MTQQNKNNDTKINETIEGMNNSVNRMLRNEFQSIVDVNIMNSMNDLEFEKKEDKWYDKFEVCSYLCIGIAGISLLGIVGLYLTWIVLSIKALTNISNDDIKDKCNESDMWSLLLTIVVYNGITLIMISLNPNTDNDKSDTDKSNNYVSEISKFCIGTALLIWCGIEIFEPCVQDNLSDNIIYNLLQYWFYFGCVMFGILLCVASCGIFVNECCDKKNQERGYNV